MNSLAIALKKYFENQIKEDAALSAVYDEKRLSDCEKYIYSQAKKMKSGNCACVQDAVVYKWARDFYYGDTESADNLETSETVQVEVPVEEVEIETKPATVIKQKKTKKESKKTTEEDELALFDMCLFSDLPEEERGSNNA